MANRNFPASRVFGMHLMPVMLDAKIPIGGTGAVGTIVAPGIKAVTRLGVGTYQIQLQDNYAQFLGGRFVCSNEVTGSAADPNGVTVNQLVQITTVGNTDWTTAGVPAGITPAVGLTFYLVAQPSAGTGRVKAMTSSGIARVELAGDPSYSLSYQPFQAANGGAYIIIQCLQAQMPAATTQGTAIQYAAADPTSGSIIWAQLFLNNSSVQ